MEDEEEILTILKILIIGESDVGKSSLLLRFTDDVFKQDTPATIGMDFKTSVMRTNSQAVKLAIWDTAGSERFRTLTPNFYRGAHGAILVYDVTRRETFNRLESWMKELEMYSTRSEIVKMVVGNKIDKCEGREDGTPQTPQTPQVSQTPQTQQVPREEGVTWTRQVPREEGVRWARQVPREEGVRWARRNSTLFIEASARTSEGVKTAFEELVQKILDTPGLWEATSRRTNIRLDEVGESDGQNWCQGWCV